MKCSFLLRKTIATLLLTTAVIAPGAAGAADDITRIVVGFAPGGALDVLARSLAEKLRGSLGGTVLVENKPGASTRLALQAVKQAPPNGKTILISPAPPFVLFPMTYPRLGYNPDKDLIPVAHLADVPLAASTSVEQPFKTMPEYLAWVKLHPESLGVGMATLGGTIHFGVLTMSKALNMPLAPTAYRGASMMMTDLVGGSLPIGIDAVAAQIGLQKAGKIRFLGVTGVRRSTLLPDVPTFKEAGVAGFDIASGWYAAFVPAGTPAPIVARLEKALIEAVKDPALQSKLATAGMEATGLPGAEAGRIIQAQRAQWKPVVEASGFTAED
ncbi:tripartite tricarboxylate transporter substrate-binding protein [Variovorax ginsengisoli]|uniref:Tripartite tricarboxylate transporter substrate-binding protein n=1 Tax=Variovorax ginsengisoli TaxID=363844 RepID=A0ABT8SD25_9BURK|nr:tripartite tricarboxylate transporter substrate-binding protein [Variovorax ginsengisoli]MDN8617485.1 tripartite tricarboxylate transporter substrate-binding protein [Variovorax ginsengisoli]MDO1536655.1 tripartite tricarboxylate transporter substrate-binding protein [Variovorax ginsengisoli]